MTRLQLPSGGKSGRKIPKTPKPEGPKPLSGPAYLRGEQGSYGPRASKDAGQRDLDSKTLRDLNEQLDDNGRDYRAGVLPYKIAGGIAASGVPIGMWGRNNHRRNARQVRERNGLVAKGGWNPRYGRMGRWVEDAPGYRHAGKGKNGAQVIHTMDSSYGRTKREKAAIFGANAPALPIAGGVLAGTGASIGISEAGARDYRRAQAEARRAKKQRLAKADDRRRTAGTAALATGSTGVLGAGVLANRITYKLNSSKTQGIDRKIHALRDVHGLDENHRPAQKLHVPSAPNDKNQGKKMARAMSEAKQRGASPEEMASIRESMAPKPHPNSAINHAAAQRKVNEVNRLKAVRTVPRVSDGARNAGRYAAFTLGTAGLWQAARRGASDNVRKYDRRDANVAALAAPAGVVAYQMPGHLAGSHERKHYYPKIKDDPTFSAIRTAHRKQHNIPVDAEKDHPNWHRYHRSYPKELPGGNMHRVMARTHTGRSGVALTGLSGLGLASAAVHADRKRRVKKNLYVKEERLQSTRAIQLGAGLGLTASGLGRSKMVGRALGMGIKTAQGKGSVHAVEALERAQAARGALRAGMQPSERALRQIRHVDAAVRKVPAGIRGDVALGAGLLLTANSMPLRHTTYRQTGQSASIRRY